MAVRVVGPVQWIVYPALLAAAVTILLATPVGLFGLSLPEPVAPMVLAFAWPLVRPSIIAPLVLAALGLFLDVLWYAPLGLWAVSLLSVYAAVLASRAFLSGQDTMMLFLSYAACCVAAFGLAYLVVSGLAGNPPSLWAMLGQVVPTLLLFPFANVMIERFDDGDVRFR